MCLILFFVEIIIKTMKNQSLVSSMLFSTKISFLKSRCLAITLHQVQFRSPSLQRNNPYAYALARKISTTDVHNRLYEKNPSDGPPGTHFLNRHGSPICPRHRITLQTNRSASHVIMKHCAAAQEIYQNPGESMPGNVISRPNFVIPKFHEKS